MYRTDKLFMKNPATAHLRIYVGNVDAQVVPEDLENKFKVHGTITGLILQRGFAFIQFETEVQAQAAISSEHDTLLNGRKINVKPIDAKKSNLPPQQPPKHIEPTENPSSTPTPLVPENDGPPLKKRPKGKFMNELEPQMDRMGPNWDRMNPRYSDNYREPYYPPIDDYTPRFEPPPPMIDRPERNDCEIIVVSKVLTEYAEYIEQRIKNLGLIVDLLFPNEDVPIGRVLANISSRGCLYAILVMPQNEENRSMTLNILHGVPQEHRNMPIEDALVLITRNFEAYMRGEKIMSTSGIMSVTDRHPEAMQILINLMAENRQLTIAQYDKLLKYLQERRELQVRHEGEEKIDNLAQSEEGKATELQNRILNILNKAADDAPKPVPPPLGNISITPLNMQKALDNLGDVLKSINSGVNY